jgi:uncharacterized repeat protein (TIGR03806 family)
LKQIEKILYLQSAIQKKKMKKIFSAALFLSLLSLMILDACKKDSSETMPDAPSNSGVSVDLSTVPYTKLSDYRFFSGIMKEQLPATGVIPYKPASSLFTDYAHKKRFIWLPAGLSGSYVADNKIIDFPVGTALIKTFYYDSVAPSSSTKIIETRVMIRKASGWIFAEYVWNDDQTEATLNMNGSFVSLAWQQNGTPKNTNYRIPSGTECLTCHKYNNNPIPIGIKPQNLNTNYTYPDGTSNQLQYFISKGILQNNLPPTIVSTIDYNDVTQPLKTRLRSYLDINCSHCHQLNSHCDYRPLRLAFSETLIPANLGQCITPDEFLGASLVSIIVPGNVNKSVMYFRLNSTDEDNRMPLLGRTIVDDVGVKLLRDYILSIANCND